MQNTNYVFLLGWCRYGRQIALILRIETIICMGNVAHAQWNLFMHAYALQKRMLGLVPSKPHLAAPHGHEVPPDPPATGQWGPPSISSARG